MSIRYKKQQNKITGSKTYGKWYGRAVSMGRITMKNLAEEISHSTTVTKADIMAVLAELSHVMKAHLQDSKVVVLDGIGSFKVGIRSTPADKEAASTRTTSRTSTSTTSPRPCSWPMAGRLPADAAVEPMSRRSSTAPPPSRSRKTRKRPPRSLNPEHNC